MQQYNCQNGQSWYDVCLNTYGSLDYLGKLVSDNGGELNVQPTTNTVIYWDQSLVKDSSLLSLIKNNGYVYNTGVQIPFPYIQSYTAGTSTIDFTNNGGDDWDIGFKITPDTVQSTANITGYQYGVDFWNGGVVTPLSDGFKTTDFTLNTVGNGSGVYELSQLYIFDDSSTFYIYSLFKVNASGTVIAYVKMQGITVNSTSGIDINATANVSQYGVSYPLQWISFDTFPPTVFNPIGNTTTINVALPIDAIGVGCIAVLDSVFTNDITDNHGMAISLIIS